MNSNNQRQIGAGKQHHYYTQLLQEHELYNRLAGSYYAYSADYNYDFDADYWPQLVELEGNFYP